MFEVARSLFEVYDHEIWHVGPLSDSELHGPSGILIFAVVVPQASGILIFGQIALQAHAERFLFEVARSLFEVL